MEQLAADKCSMNGTIEQIPGFAVNFLGGVRALTFEFSEVFIKMCKSFVCESFRSFMPFHSRQFNHLAFEASKISSEEGSISLYNF